MTGVHLGDELAELLSIFFRDALSRLFSRVTFQNSTKFKHLLDPISGNPRDKNRATALKFHQAFHFQPMDRFAHRCPTHTESLGQLLLLDPSSGWKLSL